MNITLPLDIASEVGYTENMLRKLNRGKADPSPKKCQQIIKVMAKRGVKVTFFDLRPDLKDIMMESL